MKKQTKQQKINSIKQAINLHEKMKNSYFWSPPANAHGRRSYEKYNSYSVKINISGKALEINCNTSCSCKNIYYSGEFYYDGEKKNIRILKTILNSLRNEISIKEAKEKVKQELTEKRQNTINEKMKTKTKVYKIVVISKGYKSVYDNSSWKLNVKRNGRKYYVYKNIEAAKERLESDNFPDESKNLYMPKVILECMAYGDVKDAEAGNNKYYCTHVKPIRKI